MKYSITEDNVVPLLKKGDESAFKYLFDTYYNHLCFFAESFVKDDFIAETIVGNVIYHIWEVRESLEINYSLKAYLVKSVKNRCINYLHQEYVQREKSIDEDDEFLDLYFVDEEDPSGGLMLEELEQKIYDVVDSFPVECRRVFLLSRERGLKYEQIALELDISVNTVKYHMKNALMKLRAHLRDYLDGLIRNISN